MERNDLEQAWLDISLEDYKNARTDVLFWSTMYYKIAYLGATVAGVILAAGVAAWRRENIPDEAIALLFVGLIPLITITVVLLCMSAILDSFRAQTFAKIKALQINERFMDLSSEKNKKVFRIGQGNEKSEGEPGLLLSWEPMLWDKWRDLIHEPHREVDRYRDMFKSKVYYYPFAIAAFLFIYLAVLFFGFYIGHYIWYVVLVCLIMTAILIGAGIACALDSAKILKTIDRSSDQIQ